MTRDEAGKLVAMIAGAYPGRGFGADNVKVYVELIRDLDADAGRVAVLDLLRTSERPPTIAAIRAAVAERQLGTPPAALAWEQATKRAEWRGRTLVCSECGGTGYDDIASEHVCGDCNGTGEVRETYPGAVHPIADRAADNVGGYAAIRESNAPSVIRGQFVRAYADLRDAAVRDLQLGTSATLELVRG